VLWTATNKEIRRLLVGQVIRFGIVGVINFGLDAVIFFLALAAITNSLVAANVVAWLVAVSSSYVLNTRFTFAAHAEPFSARAWALFALSQTGGLVGNTAVVLIAAPYMPLVAAKVLAVLAGFVVNFVLARLVIFRAR
jgi:putative flippase GtrA